ncbi:MAG: pyridoxine 5'-phosphate synthase [Deltaproteobacteria bacterium]|nr:pyridoxine 5'-phosphate synthase [Deltaproteobacteria bacterium]
MARLSVNVDHVATLRQARGIDEPDPVWAAVLAEKAGADGIIVHLREDRRHIQDRDLQVLRQVVKTRLNMEMAATDEMVGIAGQVKPDLCTLVPEKRQEVTTEGGLDVVGHQEAVKDAVSRLNRAGIAVSLFIDPQAEQVKAAHLTGAQVVELHTGAYANAKDDLARQRLLGHLEDSARLATRVGLRVAAGHGLNLKNIRPILRFPEVDEYSIGHSIVSRAVFVGFEQAVGEMLELVRTSASARAGEPPSRRL